jgi:hypothetical protein
MLEQIKINMTHVSVKSQMIDKMSQTQLERVLCLTHFICHL